MSLWLFIALLIAIPLVYLAGWLTPLLRMRRDARRSRKQRTELVNRLAPYGRR